MNHRTSMGARLARACAVAIAVALSVATTASAHTDFDVDEAAPGSIVALELFVENESSTAGTTTVELRFPEPMVVVELPAADGWTATPVDGDVGAPATGVVWSRPTAEPGEDPRLPLVIGPLPAFEGRLQFKVVQTYRDGRIDRWIEDWPVGAPEPQQPGPVLDLVAGAAGTIVETTVTTVAPPAEASTVTSVRADDGSSSAVITVVGIVIVLLAVAAAVLMARRRRTR